MNKRIFSIVILGALTAFVWLGFWGGNYLNKRADVITKAEEVALNYAMVKDLNLISLISAKKTSGVTWVVIFRGPFSPVPSNSPTRIKYSSLEVTIDSHDDHVINICITEGEVPDTQEARQVTETISRAYQIERASAYSLNFEDFNQVFINDPRFPLHPSTLQVVREMTYNPSLQSGGFLDYKLAYHTWIRNGILKREALEAKAKAENRELTDAEKRSLVDKYGRMAPMRLSEEYRHFIPPPLRFISVEIKNDIAVVKMDDGPRINEYTLVLVDKQWYIADWKVLTIKV